MSNTNGHIPDECARCQHAEVVHVIDTGQTESGFGSGKQLCQNCLIALHRVADPRHDYEAKGDLNRTYLNENKHVISIPVGMHFSTAWRNPSTSSGDFVVNPPCDDAEHGQWVCVTHMFSFESNQGKDFHCYIGNDSHRMVWNCDKHGPEYCGV